MPRPPVMFEPAHVLLDHAHFRLKFDRGKISRAAIMPTIKRA